MSIIAEMETEIALPVRLQYQVDEDGHLEIVALIPAPDAILGNGWVAFAALAPREQRNLEALAQADVAEQSAEAQLEGQLSAHRSEAYWLGIGA